MPSWSRKNPSSYSQKDVSKQFALFLYWEMKIPSFPRNTVLVPSLEKLH